MSWQVAIEDVALEGLPGLAQSGVPVTGRLSAHLDVSGSVARPRVAGQIGLRDVVARGARLGDATLTFAPAGEAGLAIAGSLFGRFELAAQASFGAGGPRLTATLEFRDLILEEVLPELAALGDGRGRATGRVTVAWHPAAPIEIDARLSSLAISFGRQVSGPSAPGRQRIQIRSADELRFRVVGGRMSLSPTHLVTDGGDLRAQGELVGETVQAELSGHLDLELLQPFLRDRLDSLGGDVTLAVKVSGRLPLPVISGEVAVSSPVRLRAAGFDHELTIPSGVVRVRPGTIELGNLAVAVGGAVLRLHGKANVDQRFAPTALELDVSGEISGELMETVAPSVVSDATGRARVSARVRGTPAAPDISARIDLGQMSLRLRDLGRQITVESGTVELTNRELVLRNVRTRIDDQGRLLIGAAGVRPGRVAIKRLTPTLELGEIDLPLKGDRLTYRADEVEIDDLGFTMALTGRPETGLRLRGEVLIMSGRYVGDFTVRDLVVSRRVSETSVRPFYEGKPLLADLALDLRVRTVGDSFMVQNNLAPEIHIVVDLRITGTPVDPRIAGSLRPTDGRFHIIGLRGDFELVPNVNHITFVDTKSIAAGETPELNLEAQNLVTDSLGNEHNVRMRIRGPIGQAAIDLSSDSGLDRSQTLLLLVSGRGGEELTRFGINQNPTVGSNIGRGTEMVGQLTRDTVSNLVEPYIDDTLQLLTGGTINLRPTVGADGFELRVSARVSRQLDLQLSFLRGFQDQQRYRAETNVWLMDYVRLRGFGEHLTLTPQQGLSEQVSSLNMELTLDFPLRLRRP